MIFSLSLSLSLSLSSQTHCQTHIYIVCPPCTKNDGCIPHHHSNLMAAVALLPEPPKVGHTHSISEWLQLLNLSQLERKFQGYTLKRVSNFWDIELTSVSQSNAYTCSIS